MSDDSVVLEVFFVRAPLGDERLNTTLWQEVDELQIDPAVRQRLTENGFRAGLVAGQLPMALSGLLELADKPPPGSGDLEQSPCVSLDEEPSVVRRHVQTPPGKRSEVIASDIHESLPVLYCTRGQVSGRTFPRAQGVFGVRAFPQADGRVRLQISPELHHDEPRQRWVGRQGVLRMETSRPREVYAELGLTADLLPGDMLVMTSLPSRPGSLGHHFFSAGKNQPEQKLLVIRLAQTQHDGVFEIPNEAAADPATTDAADE